MKSISYTTFDTIDSTNTYAKSHLNDFPKDVITCIVARTQTAGHGQKNRPWHSPEGGLYVTFAFHLYNEPIEHLAQLLSELVADVLTKHGLSPTIKMPNDILINGKKVGGVLCETTSKGKEIEVALGLGLNVNIPQEVLVNVGQPATSLLAETGKEHDMNLLLKEIATALQSRLDHQ